ncbi:MAG: class I SAM-dependent methyltransferase, partial [Lachnospiraceae bacterium]|nr:class I SAM-dependent methyltransferase [Lachnospiraceae bacterium]
HPEEEINEYDLTLFVKNDNKETNSFRRFQETHYQRGYRLEQMKAFIEQAGMAFVTAMDADTHGDVTPKSERILMVAKEQNKKKKIR